MSTLVLHEDPRSGNCYKIRLTASHVGAKLGRKSYDILAGDTRTPSFLANINSNGRIPVLEIDAWTFLPESNAACFYLADGAPGSGPGLIPTDRLERAEMLRWMFFEQYSHEPNLATLRFWKAFVGHENLSETQTAAIPGKVAAGKEALDVMEDHLRERRFFVGDGITLADVALFAYTHVAGEAGFDLGKWPAVSAWCNRVKAHPAHVSMDGDE